MFTICIRLGQNTLVSNLYVLHKVRSISSPVNCSLSHTGCASCQIDPHYTAMCVSTGKLEHIINVQHNEQVISKE